MANSSTTIRLKIVRSMLHEVARSNRTRRGLNALGAAVLRQDLEERIFINDGGLRFLSEKRN